MPHINELVCWLRAAGEPTRLRLVALCTERDFSVCDLAQAVGQSEPRVSRHLKILTDAGLLSRLRHGQWVHYRATEATAGASFLQGLLAQLDPADAIRLKDRERVRVAAGAAGLQTSVSDSRLGRALRAFMESGGRAAPARSALVVGVDHVELLEVAAHFAGQCSAIAYSRRAAQAARAYAEAHEFNCRVLLGTHGSVLTERDAERAGPPFDAIILDRFAAAGGALAAMLRTARGALTSQGRLYLFERYEALEASGKRVVEHPLSRLRRLLTEAGFACERLSPIEADGEHVLAALALPATRAAPETMRQG